MKQADRSGAANAVILEGAQARIHDMATGDEREVDPSRVVEELTAE